MHESRCRSKVSSDHDESSLGLVRKRKKERESSDFAIVILRRSGSVVLSAGFFVFQSSTSYLDVLLFKLFFVLFQACIHLLNPIQITV